MIKRLAAAAAFGLLGFGHIACAADNNVDTQLREKAQQAVDS